VEKPSKEMEIWKVICDHIKTRRNLSVRFVGSLSLLAQVYTIIINKSIKQRKTSNVLNAENHSKPAVNSKGTRLFTAKLKTLIVQNVASCSRENMSYELI
jgi:hypothetical protein